MKQYVTATLLRVRQHYLSLFQYGDWLPLKVSGEREENLIVYARVKDGEALIVAVPRLVLLPHKRNAVGQHFGRHPRRAFRKRYRDLFTGERRALRETLDLTSETGSLLVLLTCE